MKTFNIYALMDPRTDAVRYVGCTTMKLSRRLMYHLRVARAPGGVTRPLLIWLRELLGLGLLPCVQILEVSVDPAREIFWISELKSRGANLTNSTLGGSTISRAFIESAALARTGRPMNDCQKMALRKANCGRPMNEKTRAAMWAGWMKKLKGV